MSRGALETDSFLCWGQSKKNCIMLIPLDDDLSSRLHPALSGQRMSTTRASPSMTSVILPLGYGSLNAPIPASFPPPSSCETHPSICLARPRCTSLRSPSAEHGRSLEYSVRLPDNGGMRVERNRYECADEVQKARCWGD